MKERLLRRIRQMPRRLLERLMLVLSLVFRRAHEWRTEVPGIISGLLILAQPFRRQTGIIFLMNALAALWDAIQPLIFKWGVDQFPGASFFQVLALVMISIVMIDAPHSIIVPFFRDLYLARNFRPYFEKHLSLLCLQAGSDRADGEVSGREAPIAQEGRLVALNLTEMLFRDPVFILRGFVLIGILGWMSPTLLLVVFCGMVADLFVILLMDEELKRPYASKNEAMFQIREHEFLVYDPAHFQKERTIEDCRSWWQRYVRATREAETWRLIYQLPVRGIIALTWKATAMIIIGSWVANGTATAGDYAWFVSMCLKASDPLVVIFSVQQSVMTSRESLRRLGLLTGIDFGVSRPTKKKFISASL